MYVCVYVCLNICQACVTQETAPQFVSVYVYMCVCIYETHMSFAEDSFCLVRVQACSQLMVVADRYETKLKPKPYGNGFKGMYGIMKMAPALTLN